MLRFLAVSADRLDEVRRKGARPPEGSLFGTLEAAQAVGEAVLVVDASQINDSPDRIPADAFLNAGPYRALTAVTAAGGYVVRPGSPEPDVLLIYRRGVWDLPKGKLDDGETIEACALREVREEIGIERLALVRPLGTTMHTYPLRGKLAVKTTHWFLMRTPETRFAPQTEEDIEEVAWVSWTKARARVGYETLQRHMDAIETDVRDAL